MRWLDVLIRLLGGIAFVFVVVLGAVVGAAIRRQGRGTEMKCKSCGDGIYAKGDPDDGRFVKSGQCYECYQEAAHGAIPNVIRPSAPPCGTGTVARQNAKRV